MSYLQAESSAEWLSNGSFNVLGWFFQSDAMPQISPSLPGVGSQKISELAAKIDRLIRIL
jgi:hypothetical protein